jgi:hypothetical protein
MSATAIVGTTSCRDARASSNQSERKRIYGELGPQLFNKIPTRRVKAKLRAGTAVT